MMANASRPDSMTAGDSYSPIQQAFTMHLRCFKYSVLLLVVLRCLHSTAWSGDNPPEVAKIWAEYSLTMEQVRTGEYRAELQMFDRPNPSETRGTPIRMHVWFDRNTGHERFDYQHRDPKVSHYIQLPDSSLLINGDASHVTRQPGKLDFSQFALRPFDIWGAPLSGATGLHEGDRLEGALKYLQSGESKVSTAENTAQLEIRFPNFPTDGFVTFDLKHGMTPIEFKEVFRLPPGAAPVPPANQASTIWKEHSDGVFVPTTVDTVTTSGKLYQRAILNIEWISLNQSIDPTVFTIEGLELPNNTMVVDYSLGPPIVESIVGGTIPPGVQGKSIDSMIVRTPTPSRERLVYSIFFFLLVISIMIGVRFLRRGS